MHHLNESHEKIAEYLLGKSRSRNFLFRLRRCSQLLHPSTPRTTAFTHLIRLRRVTSALITRPTFITVSYRVCSRFQAWLHRTNLRRPWAIQIHSVIATDAAFYPSAHRRPVCLPTRQPADACMLHEPALNKCARPHHSSSRPTSGDLTAPQLKPSRLTKKGAPFKAGFHQNRVRW
jgi:hypothetical protein